MSNFFSALKSSFTTTVYADSKEEQEEENKTEATSESTEATSKSTEETAEPAEEKEAEEEEPEPEDTAPAIREACANSAKIAAATKHFEHCQEKVQGGEGFKGEDCVEEIMMHLVDECAAPKLFATLR